MANVKISDLPAASSAAGTDQLETNQSGTSRRLTVAQVATHVRSTATDTVVVAAGSAAAPSISPTGDSNTGIFFPAADTIAFAEGGVEAMRIDASGNCGLGTSSPGVRFHVNSGAADEVARFEGTGSPFITLFDTNVRQFYLNAAANSVDMVVDQSKALTLGTNGSERLRIDSSGNVGIGVNTIAPPSGFSRFIAIGDTDTGIGQISDGILAFGTNSAERMRIDGSGRVSIGSTAVNALLTVDGSGPQLSNQSFAYYAQSGGATAMGYASGQTITNSIWASDRVNAGEFNARSDGRLKKDVTPIPASDAWQFVQSVTPVHYKWINGPDDGHKFGFIAQDVVKAGFPNLVGQYPDSNVQEVTDADGFTSPAGVMLSVNYDQIVPVLASALRDALAQIDALKARVAALEAAPAQA